VLCVIDEAYAEYADTPPEGIDLVRSGAPRLAVLRTFSKVYGLAGARIGYGFAHETLIRNLLKVKLAFEPSTLAEAAGIGALGDKEFLHRSLQLNARALRYLIESFRQLELEVVDSEANFFMVVLQGEQEAKNVYERLLEQGIIVRPLGAFGLPACLRISTGLDRDNERCIVAMQKALATLKA